MASLLARTTIVLIHPTLAENVGAVARAMGNFGLHDLVLAEGGVDPLHPQAIATAAGHERILHQARRVATLDEALAGRALVIGTSARALPGVDRQAIAPREAAALAHAATGPVALVFGTESRGMTNAALRRCDQVLSIPGESGTCLNLAHAVTVCAYEWRLGATAPDDVARPLASVASEAGLDDLALRLASALEAIGLIKPLEAASKRHTLRRIASRARLSPDEAALVSGLLRGYLKTQQTTAPPATPSP